MQDVTVRSILKMENMFKPTLTPTYCNKCGTKLKVYYAEEKVYAVKCGYCEYVGVVRANNPEEATLYFGTYFGMKEGE